jgi:hypothetical protein
MKTLEQIDHAIAVECQTKENLEAQLSADAHAHDETEAKRQALAYNALTSGDSSQLIQLDEVEAKLAKVNERVASTRYALSCCDLFLGELIHRNEFG